MNKLLASGTASAFAFAFAAPLIAQTAPPPGVAEGTAPLPISHRHVPPVVQSPVQVRAAGRIVTRSEVVSHVRRVFAELDVNHDGFISRDELAAFAQRTSSEPDGTDQSAASRSTHAGIGRMAMGGPAEMFRRMDTNHDGVISRQEFMAAHASMHAGSRSMTDDLRMESGSGSTGTMRVHVRRRGEWHGGAFLARLFASADSNHDGRVSLEEAEAAALSHFDRMDLDHDGRITPDERRQARLARRSPHGG